jgi:acyl-CoA thioesterase FadM
VVDVSSGRAHHARSSTLEQKGSQLSYFVSFVRIPALAIRQHLSPLAPLGVLEEDRMAMHVWPNDVDFNLHMNNARYLSLMDYGRIHHLARVGLLTHVVRARWKPMVGAVWITYRRSLPMFSPFTLGSRLVCWDQRWFYFEQTFSGADGLSAVGWVKGVLRAATGNVSPQQVIDAVAPGTESPPMPTAMAAWNEVTREKLEARAVT